MNDFSQAYAEFQTLSLKIAQARQVSAGRYRNF